MNKEAEFGVLCREMLWSLVEYISQQNTREKDHYIQCILHFASCMARINIFLMLQNSQTKIICVLKESTELLNRSISFALSLSNATACFYVHTKWTYTSEDNISSNKNDSQYLLVSTSSPPRWTNLYLNILLKSETQKS